MAKTTKPNTIIVIDDEIHNMTWLVDYLESIDIGVISPSNVNDAIEVIGKEIYRAVVVDLNVPVLDPLKKAVIDRGGVYAKYPGLFVAERARNIGYRARQVVIYSVHKEEAVVEEANKLGCRYILKGRPRIIRDEIKSIIEFDPTAD